jgi:hypothetical protein
MPAGKPVGLPKSGGRSKGTPNKVKPITLDPTDENRALALMAPTAKVRTPKSVMLSAMVHFEELALGLIGQAKLKMSEDPELAADLGTQGHKYMVAAVQCAEKVAPYIHARLIAMESGERAADRPAFVIRAPAVMVDSSAWQTAVGAAVVDMEASAPRAEASAVSAPQPQSDPPPAPASLPMVLTTDPKTSRITVMPPEARTVQPSGTAEWLDSIKKAG